MEIYIENDHCLLIIFQSNISCLFFIIDVPKEFLS